MHFSSVLLSILPLICCVTADCKTFTPNTRPTGDTSFTTTGSHSFRTSPIVNCTSGGGGFAGSLRCNSTQCPLASDSNLYLRFNRTLNITASATVSDSLFRVARSSFQLLDKINFNQSWVYRVNGVATCLPQAQAGYWSFTPTYMCTRGRFSGCSGNEYPTDGTAAELCAVKMLSDGQLPLADGALSVVQTSGVAAEPAPANATLSEAQQGQTSGQSGSASSGASPSRAELILALPVSLCLGLLSIFPV